MSQNVAHIGDAEFASTIEKGITLVDFWAPWCGPCKMIGPILEEIAAELPEGSRIVKIDIDQHQKTAGDFGVMSIPTLVVFKDGKIVNKMVGASTKDKIKSLITDVA